MTPPTTISLLTTELVDSIRVGATVRQLFRMRLKQIKSQMKDPNAAVGVLAKLSEELVGISDAMTNTTDRVSKILLGPKGPGTDGPSPSADQVMEELLLGVKK